MSSTTDAVSLTSGAADTLRLKLHRFDFLCISCKLVCIVRRYKSTKWSSGLTVLVCANNRQVTVYVAMCFKYLAALLPGDFTWYLRFCVRQRRAVRRR